MLNVELRRHKQSRKTIYVYFSSTTNWNFHSETSKLTRLHIYILKVGYLENNCKQVDHVNSTVFSVKVY